MQSLAMKVLVETSKELVVEFGAVRRTATPFIGASIPLVAALVTRTAYPEGSPSLAWGAGLSGLLLSRWAMQRIGTTVQWRFTSKFGCFQKFVRPYFSSDYAEDNGGGGEVFVEHLDLEATAGSGAFVFAAGRAAIPLYPTSPLGKVRRARESARTRYVRHGPL